MPKTDISIERINILMFTGSFLNEEYSNERVSTGYIKTYEPIDAIYRIGCVNRIDRITCNFLTLVFENLE